MPITDGKISAGQSAKCRKAMTANTCLRDTLDGPPPPAFCERAHASRRSKYHAADIATQGPKPRPQGRYRRISRRSAPKIKAKAADIYSSNGDEPRLSRPGISFHDARTSYFAPHAGSKACRSILAPSQCAGLTASTAHARITRAFAHRGNTSGLLVDMMSDGLYFSSFKRLTRYYHRSAYFSTAAPDNWPAEGTIKRQKR